MRTRFVVIAASMALLVAGSAVAAPILVEPSELPRGANPRIAVGEGFQIRTGKGEIVPLPPSDHGMRLLGKTPQGWVVQNATSTETDYHWILYLVQAGGSFEKFHERIQPKGDDSIFADYRLSADRTRVIEVIREDASLRMAVLDLEGNEVVPVDDGPHGSTAIAFSGPRAILSTPFDLGNTYAWRIGSEPRLVTRHASVYANIEHDLLSRRMADGTFGLARISRPKAVRWKAAYRPISLSPDGTKLIGNAITPAGPMGIIQVRRVTDGKVLRAFKARRTWVMASESNKSFLFPSFQTTPSRGHVLVRCTVGGYCTRTTPLFDRPDAFLTLPLFR